MLSLSNRAPAVGWKLALPTVGYRVVQFNLDEQKYMAFSIVPLPTQNHATTMPVSFVALAIRHENSLSGGPI